MIRPRTKPRPGRLKGEDRDALRLACFMRDGGRCVKCGMRLAFAPDSIFQPNAYHMAHVRNKRMWGDTLENVVSKCRDCHLVQEHAGGKPCPPKPKTMEAR